MLHEESWHHEFIAKHKREKNILNYSFDVKKHEEEYEEVSKMLSRALASDYIIARWR
jgi:hypothetical protein